MIWLIEFSYNNYIFRSNQISWSSNFYEIYHQDKYYLKSVTISCVCRFYTRTTISHPSNFMRYFSRTRISLGCRIHEILHLRDNFKNHNTSWLQIFWGITSHPKYLIVANFVRYYTRTTKCHGCIFHEIVQQIHNISCLQILWDIYTRTTMSHGCRFYEISHQNYNISWF